PYFLTRIPERGKNLLGEVLRFRLLSSVGRHDVRPAPNLDSLILQRMDAAEQGGRAPGNRVSHDLEGGGPVDQTGHDHRKPVVWIAVVPHVLSDPGSLPIKLAVVVAEPIALEDGVFGPRLWEPLVPSLPDCVSLADEREQPISMRVEISH